MLRMGEHRTFGVVGFLGQRYMRAARRTATLHFLCLRTEWLGTGLADRPPLGKRSVPSPRSGFCAP
jgi:hypothetical protein